MQNIIDFVHTVQGTQIETIINILLALLIALTFNIFSSVLAFIIIKIFRIKEKKKEKIKENPFYKPLSVFFSIFGIYAAMLFLNLSADIIAFATKLFRIAIICLTAYGLGNSLNSKSNILKKIYRKSDKNESMLNIIAKIIRAIIYIIAAFLVATELNFNLNGLIAGLGISGVIVTLAAQDTAKNLFGGMVIFLDKPFKVGDWIETENYEGVVEDITFRSTRIRNFENSLVNIPNSILANASIVNWSKMESRRYKMELKLALDTPLDVVEKITNKLYFALKNHPHTINDTLYVKMDEIKEDGISILVYVFTDSIDYNSYLATKQSINFDVLQILEHEGVKLAYPTQMVYVKEMEETEAPIKKVAKKTAKKTS